MNLAGFFAITAAACGQTGTPVQVTFDPQNTNKHSLSWSWDGDWFGFGYQAAGSTAIEKIRVNGTGRATLVSSTTGWVGAPAWGPDDRHVFFLMGDQSTVGAAGYPARVAATGTLPGPVTRLDSRPAWDYQLSRSGRWLFSNFGPELFEQRGLAMIDVPAGSVHDLLAPGAGPFRVKASPDGLGVAYYDRRAIRLLAPWGSPEMWRASVQANCLYNWSWSPEGDRLAVVGFGCQSPSGIELLWSRPFAGVSHSLGAPWINSPAAWSPCGSYLAAFRRTGGPQNDLVLVHVPSGQVTPLHPSATQVSKYGVVWSPFRDEVAWINVSGATNTTEVFRAGTGLAPAPAVVGPLTPGSRNRVLLRAPVEVGRAYRMGAAFSSTPGLPTPQGTIPLSLDPLLLASRSASEVFEGFGGVLDGSGRAEASLNVPPGDRLSGMRFYLAYVTLDSSGGLRMISAAIPVFVQPR